MNNRQSRRPEEVARRAGVAREVVEEVSVEDVRAALAERLPPNVLEAGTQLPATYWRAADRYFLDDPQFGDVADFTDLAYDAIIGLHVKEPQDAARAVSPPAGPGGYVYRVGSLYHPGRSRWPEGVEYNYRDGGHELRLFFGDPSPEEVGGVDTGEIEFGLLVERDALFLLFQIGAVAGPPAAISAAPRPAIPWADAPYNWWLNEPARRRLPEVPESGQRALLSIFLVDASSGILRAMRAITFSPEFTEALHEAIRRQSRMAWRGADEYQKVLQAIYRRYPDPAAMVAATTIRCVGGR